MAKEGEMVQLTHAMPDNFMIQTVRGWVKWEKWVEGEMKRLQLCGRVVEKRRRKINSEILPTKERGGQGYAIYVDNQVKGGKW